MRAYRLVMLSFFVYLAAGCSAGRLAWLAPVEDAELWGIVRLQIKADGVSDVQFYLDEIADDAEIERECFSLYRM